MLKQEVKGQQQEQEVKDLEVKKIRSGNPNQEILSHETGS